MFVSNVLFAFKEHFSQIKKVDISGIQSLIVIAHLVEGEHDDH